MTSEASAQPAAPRPVSVIATVRDEIESMPGLISGLMGGDRVPDEIVIADAGSTDGTREFLAGAANGLLRVLDVPGNRSRGRNAAVEAATHDVIAAIDGGCVPDPGWLAEITAPFAGDARWVGGFYRPVGTTKQQSIGVTMVYVRAEAESGGFLPSARSMAFDRSVWRAVGGFPEHLEVSEDTAFDEALLAHGVEMMFAPRAVVGWHPPATLRDQLRVVWTWSRSDGEAGIGSFGYRRQAAYVVVTVLATVGLAFVSPWLVVAGLVPGLRLMWSETRHKYAAVDGLTKFVWIPVAWMVGLVARLGGFGVGWWQRRRA